MMFRLRLDYGDYDSAGRGKSFHHLFTNCPIFIADSSSGLGKGQAVSVQITCGASLLPRI